MRVREQLVHVWNSIVGLSVILLFSIVILFFFLILLFVFLLVLDGLDLVAAVLVPAGTNRSWAFVIIESEDDPFGDVVFGFVVNAAWDHGRSVVASASGSVNKRVGWWASRSAGGESVHVAVISIVINLSFVRCVVVIGVHSNRSGTRPIQLREGKGHRQTEEDEKADGLHDGLM
jgi:hypothetical protein